MNEIQPHPAFATPMNLLDRAISSGAPMEMIKELMALVEHREKTEARKAFSAALAEASAKLPNVIKTKLVDFTSAKGRTRYMHESLDDVVKAVRPVLAEHGLSFRFRLHEGPEGLTVTCIIEHAGGHSEENSLSAPRDDSGNKNVIQAKGSACTYLQRITLKASLGLAAALDDDGQSAAPPGAPPRDKITAEQAAQLVGLVAGLEDQMALTKILGRFRVQALPDLEASNFNQVLDWLRKKKQAEQEASATAEGGTVDGETGEVA
jgi:hypothetical protein